MGPMVFWIGSILEAFIFNGMNSKRLYKDLADAGYKFKFTDDMVVDLKESPLYRRFIPILNLVDTANNILEYNYFVGNTIEYLKREGMVSPMSKEEIKYYQMKPTAKTAMLIAESDYQRRKFGNMIVIHCDDGDTKITYYFDFDNNRIDILSIDGLLAEFREEDAINIVSEIINGTLAGKFKEYGSVANYYKAIMDGRENVSTIVVQANIEIKEENDEPKLTRKPKNK